MGELTVILERAQNDPKSADELLAAVYDELRKLAAAKLNRETPGNTLQPTALVHEAWLRITLEQNPTWNSRAHFFGAAAEAMRRILIESARRKASVRHGKDYQRVDWTNLDVALEQPDERLVAVSEALDRLAAEDPQCAELVKLRFFAGLSNLQAAEMLGLPERTAKRRWAYARARLIEELKHGA